ncbi:TIGR03086 family metal-binding protein [Spirillospora sp. NPDC047279]|uniref:TIGR03086 family metal-binding protein n=1 Tax=Spirillospora sp. NPDC047279 TaxID=3155478 RepID=UPI0034084095
MNPDLGPATRYVAELIARVHDDRLTGPTPCPAYTLGDLLDHVNGLSYAFTLAAAKSPVPGGSQGPSGDASRLPDGWRESIPERLAGLADAWRKDDAWDGMTEAGGIQLPGQVAGLVALNEVVVHGWDVARSSGQPYEPPAEAVEACIGFLGRSPGEGPFGTPVPVPDDAPPLDRLVGLAGRDPGWRTP